MIEIDDREGASSRQSHLDIPTFLRARGVPHVVKHLPFGDAAFIGQGPEGRPVSVGVEIKAVSDLIQCMVDDRFVGHQLPGLRNTYEQTYLVIEGPYRPGADGVLEVLDGSSKAGGHGDSVPFRPSNFFSRGRKGAGRSGPSKSRWVPYQFGQRRFMYRDIDNFLTTMEILGGIRLRRVANRSETAHLIADLYGWWGKEWEDHHAHLGFDESSRPDAVFIRKPSLVCEFAARFPGIGWKRAHEVEKYFKTIEAMILGSEEEWAEIRSGKVNARIGKSIARTIVDGIRTPFWRHK